MSTSYSESDLTKERLRLRWNDFESNIVDSLRSWWQCRELYDVSLIGNDPLQKVIRAHKLVLSASSDFFKQLFISSSGSCEHSSGPPSSIIYLRGVSHDDLQSIVDFIYNGEVRICQDRVEQFLSVAEDLHIKGLTRAEYKAERQRLTHPPSASAELQSRGRKRTVPAVLSSTNNGYDEFDLSQEQEDLPQSKMTRIDDDVDFAATLMGTEAVSERLEMLLNETDRSVDDVADQSTRVAVDCDVSLASELSPSMEVNVHPLNPESIEELDDAVSALLVKQCSSTSSSSSQWTCAKCPRTFRDRTDAARHVESAHINIRFQCPSCDKTSKSRHLIKRHLQRWHGNQGDRLKESKAEVCEDEQDKVE